MCSEHALQTTGQHGQTWVLLVQTRRTNQASFGVDVYKRQKDKKAYVSKDKTIDKANGKPRIWQVLRLARIEKAELVKPTKQINIPNMPVSELRKWSFDNGTDAVFITDQRDLAFIKTLPGATVEQCGAGEKVHLTVSSDSWFVAFCIAHARHILSLIHI